jgi:Gram-negative porin
MHVALRSLSVVLETGLAHVHYNIAESIRRCSRTSMAAVTRSPGAAIVVGALVALATTDVQAASEVEVGGFHDQAIATTQQDLVNEGPAPATSDGGGRVQMRLNAGPTSALTAFTPRLGGLAIAGRRHSEANLQVDEAKEEPQQLQLGLSDTAEIAGWEIGLAATADMGHAPAVGAEGGSSALVVGGQLAVSGLHFDAAIGRDSALLGEPGKRMTAGVGYDFGPLDTQMSYSVVESEERTGETGLLTLGTSLALSPRLALRGDLAIAEEHDGDGTTAGRVSLRLNF